MHVYSHDCMKSYSGRDTRTQPLFSVRYPVQLIGEISEIFICVDTHLPRFEALAHVVPHFDALTHVVIRGHVLLSSKSVFHLFLDPLLKTLFIFFFIVGAAWCFSSGNWYYFVSCLWHSFTDGILAILYALQVCLSFFSQCSLWFLFLYIYICRKRSILR